MVAVRIEPVKSVTGGQCQHCFGCFGGISAIVAVGGQAPSYFNARGKLGIEAYLMQPYIADESACRFYFDGIQPPAVASELGLNPVEKCFGLLLAQCRGEMPHHPFVHIHSCEYRQVIRAP